MRPVLFRLGKIEFYSYGLMVGLGFLLGGLVASRRASRRGVDVDSLSGLLGILLIGGIAGGRVAYVLTSVHRYTGLLSILNLRDGGLSIHGVLAGGLVSAAVYARIKRVSLLETLDLLTPSVLLGQSVGRIGCLLAGCCYGVLTSQTWGVRTRFAPGLRHPYPLYESLGSVLLFLLVMKVEGRIRFAGGLFAVYLGGYSALRFGLEFLRDNDSYFARLSYGQWVSLGLVLLSSLYFWVGARKLREGAAAKGAST